jgi:hypothetical protein
MIIQAYENCSVEPRMGANTVAKLDRDLVRELKQTNHEAPRPKRCKKML